MPSTETNLIVETVFLNTKYLNRKTNKILRDREALNAKRPLYSQGLHSSSNTARVLFHNPHILPRFSFLLSLFPNEVRMELPYILSCFQAEIWRVQIKKRIMLLEELSSRKRFQMHGHCCDPFTARSAITVIRYLTGCFKSSTQKKYAYLW